MKPLQLSKPYVIAMVGIPGAGKTYFASHFAQTFNAALVSNAIIGSNVESYDSIETLTKYMLGELYKSQATIIYDGDLRRRSDRSELIKSAKQAGYETLLVWVQTDTAAAKSRFVKSQSIDRSSAADLFEQEFRKFTIPNSLEKHLVISGKHTYASQLKIVLTKIADARPAADAVNVRQTVPPRQENSRRIAIR